MLGLNTKETIVECYMSEKTYHKYSRAIYNTLNELFGLKAESQADKLLAEVHYAIHNEEFNSDKEKMDRFELFFHLLKKNQLEQKSHLLLAELNELHKDSPLEAVYSHLYTKYLRYSEVNEKALAAFIDFNTKLSDFHSSSDENEKALKIREMVKDCKILRQYLEAYENNTLKAIYLLAKLSLIQVCDQKQLLIEKKLSLKDLLEQTKSLLSRLPFGTEKYFLQNIFWQLESAQLIKDEGNYPAASQQSNFKNLNFPILVKVATKRTFTLRNAKRQKVVSHTRFVKYKKISNQLSGSISTMNNFPRGSMSYSAT